MKNLKRHAISFAITFFSSFGLVFFGGLQTITDVDKTFLTSLFVASLVAGVRSVSKVIYEILNLK